MIKLKQLLLEYNKQDILNKMYQYWKECLQKYFDRDEVGGKYPRPEFELKRDSKRSGWFKYKWISDAAGNKYRSNEMTIGINPDFAMDDDLLKGIVYHETIHYYEFLYFKYEEHIENTHNHHGEFFTKMMNKINSGEGKKLVTIKAELIDFKKTSKPFWVYGVKNTNGDYWFTWSLNKSQKLIDYLAKTVDKYENVFLFQTTNMLYMNTVKHQSVIKFSNISKMDGEYTDIINDMIQYAEKNNTYKRKKDTVH